MVLHQVIQYLSRFSNTPAPLAVAGFLFILSNSYQLYYRFYEIDEVQKYIRQQALRFVAFSVGYASLFVAQSPSAANGLLVVMGLTYTYIGKVKPFYRNYSFLAVFIGGFVLFFPDSTLIVVDYLQELLGNLATIIQSRPLTSSVVILTYLAWKQSANETRFEREEALRTRLQGKAKTVVDRLNPDETLKIVIQDIRVREQQGFLYQIRKYFPGFLGGGFSGASEIVAQYDSSYPITMDWAWAELAGTDVFSHITDFSLSESKLTTTCNTASLPTLEKRISEMQEALFKISRGSQKETVAGGHLKCARARYYIPSDFIHRLLYLQEYIEVIRRTAHVDRILLWRISPEITGLRRKPKLIVEKEDGSKDEFESISMWSEVKTLFTRNRNPVFDGITRLRRVYEDISVSDVIEEDYASRGGEYTGIIFEIRANHVDTLTAGVREGFQTHDDGTEVSIRTPSVHDEVIITVDDDFHKSTIDKGETFEVCVPVSGFVPAAFDSLNNEPVEAAGIDRDEQIGEYLNDQLDAELVSSDDYALFAYYRLDEERYCSVRWPPTGNPRIWRVGTCSKSAPLPRRGYTVWEQANTDYTL